jgi:putative cell wall-binding protein
MKKILAILVMLAALLASCEDSHSESSNVNYSIYVDTIRGHEYIILNGMNFGDIIHSASCPCKKGGEE